MEKAILFVDGENFRKTLTNIFIKDLKISNFDIFKFDFNKLFQTIFYKEKILLKRKFYYAAKIKRYNETLEKSQNLISMQRKLINYLSKIGFKYIISGNVNRYKVGNKLIFIEKGVDVRLAVDLMTYSVSNEMDIAYLFSSDSDLIPAINEIRARGVKVVYLGFEDYKNNAIIYSTDKKMLIKTKTLIKMLVK